MRGVWSRTTWSERAQRPSGQLSWLFKNGRLGLPSFLAPSTSTDSWTRPVAYRRTGLLATDERQAGALWSKQCLDRAALVHRAISFGYLFEWQGEIENPTGVDLFRFDDPHESAG